MTNAKVEPVTLEGPAPKSAEEKEREEREARRGKAVLTMASEVRTVPVRWLWRGRIPLGKITIIDGDPGLGKSTVAGDIEARITTGRPMPGADALDLSADLDTSTTDLRGPRGVVILSAEDDPADTIVPRLMAAGADLDRVVILSAVQEAEGARWPSLADLPALEEAVRKVDAAYIRIDPVMAYLGKNDSHKDQDVRALLGPLAILAARLDVAIVLVRHLNKSAGGSPLYRGGGSIGIVGASRSALLVARDPADPSRRILALSKSNLAPDDLPSLSYRIGFRAVKLGDVVADVSCIEWEGTSDLRAGDLLTPPKEDREAPLRDKAEAFLSSILSSGPKPAAQVQASAAAAHISVITLRRAKEKLGVIVRQVARAWVWQLPGEAWEPGSDAHEQDEHLSPADEVRCSGAHEVRCSHEQDEHLSFRPKTLGKTPENSGAHQAPMSTWDEHLNPPSTSDAHEQDEHLSPPSTSDAHEQDEHLSRPIPAAVAPAHETPPRSTRGMASAVLARMKASKKETGEAPPF